MKERAGSCYKQSEVQTVFQVIDKRTRKAATVYAATLDRHEEAIFLIYDPKTDEWIWEKAFYYLVADNE